MIENKRREKYVDIAKAIAIIAVVIGHVKMSFTSSHFFPDLGTFIYLWHVPLFFLIAGFFLRNENLSSPKYFIKNKILKLYVPMTVIYLLVQLFHNVFMLVGWYLPDVDYGGKFVDYWTLLDYAKNMGMTIFLAGREPLLGAMWFVFVLFIALCGMSVITYISEKASSGRFTMEKIRFIIIFTLFVLSFMLTKLHIFSVPRFNNSFTAIWLIYVGMCINRVWQWRFNSFWSGLLCFVAVYSYCFITEGVSLNENRFDGVVTLSIISLCALYSVCYVSKKMENSVVGNIMAYIGENSFYVMAFHFIGFKVCMHLLNCVGYDFAIADLMPDAGENVFLWILFILFGTAVPLLIISVYRKIKKTL